MNPPQKRPAPCTDATSASALPKKSKILTTPSGIALPQKRCFDPWNSSATGHQRAENKLAESTCWRDSRSLKLSVQYQAGRGGGKRVADTVGAGSEGFATDGRKANGGWRKNVKGAREKDQRSLEECLGAKDKAKISTALEGSQANDSELLPKSQREEDEELRQAIVASLQEQKAQANRPKDFISELPQAHGVSEEPNDDFDRAIAASIQDQRIQAHFEITQEELDTIPPSYQTDNGTHTTPDQLDDEGSLQPPRQIFRSLCFYINGSTAPLVSDHKLKYLISSHGGSLSLSHSRKTVTHVIIGTAHNHLIKGSGAGGALAGTKIQKEITRTRGKGVKYVGVEWVLDSVKAGKRVSEAIYENVRLGGARQGCVFEKFRTTKPKSSGVGKREDDMNDEELGII